MDIAAAIDEIKSILDHSDIGFDKNMVWYIWGKEKYYKIELSWVIYYSLRLNIYSVLHRIYWVNQNDNCSEEKIHIKGLNFGKIDWINVMMTHQIIKTRSINHTMFPFHCLYFQLQYDSPAVWPDSPFTLQHQRGTKLWEAWPTGGQSKNVRLTKWLKSWLG